MCTNHDFSKMTDQELERHINAKHKGVYAYPNDSEEWLEETRRIVKEMKERDLNVPYSIDISKYLKPDESKPSK